jgi:hypothetical protein
LFVGRHHCPQCKEPLTWWGRMSWEDEWDCPRCGCQIDQSTLGAPPAARPAQPGRGRRVPGL